MARRTRTSKAKPNGDGQAALAFSGDGDPPANGNGNGAHGESRVALHEAAQTRYLNYALSVITSRALPDVRDGLKPVHRRILYTMWQAGLRADAKHRKSAKVVGDVMGGYHPHGDQAIYDALVRMAQPWVMRHALVDGSGNFGSIDDDPPAAMRYTECRLTAIAATLLDDIGRDTVHFRPNYDGTRSEPVVLPAKLPNLLVNGSAGIAVGMATNIPPHNLNEVCQALLKLLKDPECKPYQLVANDAIQGPDFPTGGQIVNTRDELREIYKTGAGSIKLRGTTAPGSGGTRSTKVLSITSIPYGVNKAALVAAIGDLVENRKLPLLLSVRDVSTDDIRIDLELKKDADEAKVLAYLYRHTPLQTNFNVNLTCLVPTENPDVAAPMPPVRDGAPGEGGDLKTILWHFLHFRLDVVTRRLEHELRALEKRVHILDGFAVVFDALDEIIKIIRGSDGKADAAAKIMKRFDQLDEEQTDAILELKLYRLAKLEINLVLEELKEKNKRIREIKKLLAEDADDMAGAGGSGRWGIVREEIEQLAEEHGKGDAGKRRTLLPKGDELQEEPTFSAEDFIVAEDNHVLVTRDGWVKRQKEIKDPQNTRLREGDAVLACEAGSTRATIAFFSNFGTAYTARIADLPATTGYGEPIQKLFKLKDGEHLVAAVSLDPRAVGEIAEKEGSDYAPMTHAFAASSDGYALRFGLSHFVEPSTRNGRKFARPSKAATIVGVEKVHGSETILAASKKCRAMVCAAEEVNYLSGPGKGVLLIKLAAGDELLGFKASQGDRDLLTVETNRGAEKNISTAKYEVTSRGGRGREVQKTGGFTRILTDPVEACVILDDED